MSSYFKLIKDPDKLQIFYEGFENSVDNFDIYICQCQK